MRNFGYLLREGFRSVWKNRLMAAASICVLVACILITGFASLAFININSVFEQIGHQNFVVAYAQKGASEADVKAMGETIKGIQNVSGVEFLSKDEILERYKSSFSEELFQQLQGENNPMQDAYIITFYDLELFDETLAKIEALPQTESVSADNGLAEKLAQIRNILVIAGLVVVVLLVLVSLFIISNTIKLTVYSRRLEIAIMKAVGATNAFIRMPFVVEGAVLGLISAALSYGITWLAYDKVLGMFDGAVLGMDLVPFDSMWWLVLVAYVAGGMLTGILGSGISMGRYLKDEGGAPV